MESLEHNPTKRNLDEWYPHQLGEIIDAIEANKCVLILGNYAFSKPASSDSMGEEFFLPELLLREQKKWSEENPGDNPQDFFTIAQSLLKKGGGQRMFIELTDIKLKDLGERQRDRFKKISEIPFDLILSTYPFELLEEVFTENHIAHDFGYYSFMQEVDKIDELNPEKPMIYNLFGSVKHKESMVISLERLYKFLFGVIGKRQLPKLIEDKISQATHLVFLGCSFDDWHMKLLLRFLKVHEKVNSYAHPAKTTGFRPNNQMFFENNFRVTFLDKQIDEFVDGLHEKCQNENLLRLETLKNGATQYHQLKTLLNQYQLEEAMNELDDLLLKNGKEGELLKKLGTYQKRFENIKEEESYDGLSKDESQSKRHELREHLFGFLTQTKNKIGI